MQRRKQIKDKKVASEDAGGEAGAPNSDVAKPPLRQQAWADTADPQGVPPQIRACAEGHGLALAADVGGTNSRFMLYDIDLSIPIMQGAEAPGTLVFMKKYGNLQFSSFSAVVQRFLDDVEQEVATPPGTPKSAPARCWIPEVACLAVAGVVQQNLCRLTNLDWVIDGPGLGLRFGIAHVEVINDFVAQGYGVLTLSDNEVQQIAGPAPVLGGPIACVGAGTGLGQCFLTASAGGEYQAFPSEGGHAEFAPRGAGCDDTQIELLKFLKVKFSGWNRISFERVVSGKGICNVYEFLAYKNPTRIDKDVHNQILASKEDTSIIAKNAKPGSLCYEALQIFGSCYGQVCGTYALQVMPFGGLYISGGVTQRLQTFLQEDGGFLEAYFDKGRVSPMLQDVPLFFVKGDEMGQRGAHLRTVRLLHHYRNGMEFPTVDRDTVHLAPPRDAVYANMLREFDDKASSTGQNFRTAPIRNAD